MANDATLAVDLHDVAKTYGRKVHALRGIEMQVHRGEIFGLLGPNGAGKSTLVKIMTTVVHPTRAKGYLLGKPIGDKGTLRRIGYLPEHHKFPPYLTGRQVIEFYGAMAKVPRSVRKKRAGELLELVGMAKWGNAKVGTYSKGMRQRVGLAQALASDPELVILDEPTDGVDPTGRKEIREMLRTLRDRGKTVFINSHLLSELEMICDRVAILVKGKVISQGTIDDLTLQTHHYEIRVPDDVSEMVIRQAIDSAYDSPGRAASRPAAVSAAAPSAAPPAKKEIAPVSKSEATRIAEAKRQRSFLDSLRPEELESAEGPKDAPPQPRPESPIAAEAIEASNPPQNSEPESYATPATPITPLRRPPQFPHGGWFELHDHAIHMATTDPQVIQPVIDSLRRRGIEIVEVRRVRQSLEQLYLEKTAGTDAGAI